MERGVERRVVFRGIVPLRAIAKHVTAVPKLAAVEKVIGLPDCLSISLQALELVPVGGVPDGERNRSSRSRPIRLVDVGVESKVSNLPRDRL